MNDIPAAAEAMLKIYKRSPNERKEMGMKSRAIAEKVDISITTTIKLDWFKEVVKNFK